MRTLTATLTTAQKAATRMPYIKLEAHNKVAGVERLIFTRLYTGAEAESHHSACIAGDGSLIRARLSGGKIYRQRVASPGAGSDYTSWTNTTKVTGKPIALCASGSEVSLFWVDGTLGAERLRRLVSTDNGATFPTDEEVANLGADAACTGLAAAYSANGSLVVFLCKGTDDRVRWARKPSGGAWSSYLSIAPVAGATIKDVGCCSPVSGNETWPMAYTGTDSSGNACLWIGKYDYTPNTIAGTTVHAQSQASAYTYKKPYLAAPDSVRLWFLEDYTGTTAYTRVFFSYTVSGSAWSDVLLTEPQPFNHTCAYGLAPAVSANDVWLCKPAGVWKATKSTASSDLSADVLRFVEKVTPRHSELKVEMANDDGGYNTLPAALDVGSELRLAIGYATTAGNESMWTAYYDVQAIEWACSGGRATLVLTATGQLDRLDRWKAPRQFRWNKDGATEKNVRDIIKYVLARAGLAVTVTSASSVLTGFYPDFTIYPNQSGASISEELMSYAEDVIRNNLDKAEIVDAQASDAADYAYGAGHTIIEARYMRALPETTRVRAEGRSGADPVLDEAYDFTNLDKAGQRYHYIFDLDIDLAAEATDRVSAVMRDMVVETSQGSITVPANAGIQLYDVLEITDSRAGLSAVKRRTAAYITHYDARKKVFAHDIGLSGV